MRGEGWRHGYKESSQPEYISQISYLKKILKFKQNLIEIS